MSKVWFITGSSRGFGREFALVALERGHRVAATARNTGTLTDLVERFGDAVLPLRLEVTDRAQVFEAVAVAKERFGRLDVVRASS
ncbi:SDR family NAD(P)-dependent oxidoreductase [Streptomyces sp. NPDC102270]|uniref:SDR family NAD(P)-dependent oxidoreductase n=1 Tax=Streptomyces sp. NPDC102270 TaxID=3366150 RepID=UPI0037FB4D9D